jgi:hypothetical protein
MGQGAEQVSNGNACYIVLPVPNCKEGTLNEHIWTKEEAISHLRGRQCPSLRSENPTVLKITPGTLILNISNLVHSSNSLTIVHELYYIPISEYTRCLFKYNFVNIVAYAG